MNLRQDSVYGYVNVFRSFEKLLDYRKQMMLGNDDLANRLCRLYAAWGRFRMQTIVKGSIDFDSLDHRALDIKFSDPDANFPSYVVLKKAADSIVQRIATSDQKEAAFSSVSIRLDADGNAIDQIFDEMELISASMTGNAQQILFVDLSLFAVQIGDFVRASEYAKLARKFELRSRELYHILVIEGTIAWRAGQTALACELLAQSSVTSQMDADASIQCSLLSPNLILAEYLLSAGEQIRVIEHLCACMNVWQSRRDQIEMCISQIENGRVPSFECVEFPRLEDRLAFRLNAQWMRALQLQMYHSSKIPKSVASPSQVLAERERRVSAHKESLREFIDKMQSKADGE